LTIFANTFSTFKISYLGISNFGFLSLYPFRTEKMSISPLTPKLHHFEFQNYNTHPAQNKVVLAITFFKKMKIEIKKKKIKRKKKKRKKDENREWLPPWPKCHFWKPP
jgi:hypothetical protein